MSSEKLERIKSSAVDVPRHIAIIMDGNGRWARERNLPRREGHRNGMKSVREVVEASIAAGVEILSLYAFSEENWKRPAQEIAFLMRLLQRYAKSEARELAANGVEVHVVGDLERLSDPAKRAIEMITETTRGGENLQLILAISYGSRSELVRAARRLADLVRRGEVSLEEIDEGRFAAELMTARWPDPDLLIRTSGEYRISNFMLWQLAYTELYTTPVLWPDFGREAFFDAILDYQRRERRFGKVTV